MARGSLPRRSCRAHLLGAAFPPYSLELLRIVAAASLAMAASPAMAGPVLPTGGSVAAGNAGIGQPAGNTLTVSQSSQRAIINWGSFSIGAGGTVDFNNGNGATLNRVTGGSLSQIDGSLKATGSVYLINPQGIVIGPGGQVIANGSFVASTRDVSNNAFMSGAPFQASGTSSGSIVNEGIITSLTGDAILVGQSVTNSGTISAPNGTVGLAAGNEITLQPAGGDARIAISGGTGSVSNSGNIRAAQAELNAAGGNVYALAENNAGVISATGTQNIGGHVWLTAGGTGTVTIAGAVNAQNASGSGGVVSARGYNISLPGSINASATNANSAGGAVSVIASNNTSVTGSVAARGGASGNGGSIETSGHTLVIGGAKIDAGQGGNWLLDPYDLTVDSTAATTINGSLGAGTSVMLQTTTTGTSGPGIPNASGTGTIYIDSAINWGTSATLTLSAYNPIVVNAPITVTGAGGVVLDARGVYPTKILFGTSGYISYGATNNGGTLSINGTPYTLLYSMSDVQNINSSSTALDGNYALATSLDASSISNWTPIGTTVVGGNNGPNNSNSGFAGTFVGLGNTISSLTINLGSESYAGLFGVSTGVIQDLVLAGGSVSGFSDVGALVGSNEGLVAYDYASTAVGGTRDVGGLVGRNAGVVTASYDTGIVTGAASSSNIGGLVGGNIEGIIVNSYTTGAVSGSSDVGGLVGGADIDGLTLQPGGQIIGSFATGPVNGAGYAGGLVGYNAGASIDTSYATGNVASLSGGAAGGLVGYNYGNGSTITDSYATGTVSIAGNGGAVGGLVGNNVGATITSSYATGSVSGVTNSSVGGLVGNDLDGSIGNSYAVGSVTSSGTGTSVGGLLGSNTAVGAISNSYATGAVTSTGTGANLGGLVGYNDTGGTISASYWDTQTSGLSSAIGTDNNNQSGNVAGLTTAQLSSALPSGFSSSIWGNVNNQTTPYLLANPGPVYIGSDSTDLFTLVFTLGEMQAINSNLNGNYALANSLDATSATGWTPIGTDGASNVLNSGNGFAGIFNGLGNTISNLTIASPSANNVGLFGYSSGTISDVGLIGGSVSGGGFTVGGLVGWNAGGTISNAYTTGSVSGTGNGFVGGLVGLSGLPGVNAGTITNSYASGAVTDTIGVNDNVGGLAGANTGTINNSYASGAVTGNQDVGGLVGFNLGGAIDNSNAYGSVTGSNFVGGLVGQNGGGVSTSITGSSASGSVTGDNYVGGLVGINFAGATISNSSASGSVSGSQGVGGLAGENDGSITDDSAGADIFLTSSGPGGQIGGLVGYNSSTGTITGSSSSGSVAVGGTSAIYIGGLVGLNGGSIDQSSSNVSVTGQTDVGGLVGYNMSSGTITQSSAGSGEVCGCGSGLVTGYLNVGGLVGWNQGSITKSDAEDSVTGITGASAVGGIAGLNDSGALIGQTTATGSVQGTSQVGGAAGINSGSITLLTVTSNVSGAGSSSSDVGGLVGYNTASGSIQSALAGGNVSGRTAIGGLVGDNAGSIVDGGAAGNAVASINNGATLTSDAGGLVGINESGATIESSFATGNVSGRAAGGLVGYNLGSVTESWAGGAVIGGSTLGPGAAGGLIGIDGANSVTTYDYAIGSVSGPAVDTGGLIGVSYGPVSEVYASGALLSTGGGGLIGDVAGHGVADAYWDNTAANNANAFAAVAAGAHTSNIGSDSYANGSAYAQSTYSTFTFGAGGAWYMINGETRPFLTAEAWTTGGGNYVVVNAHQLQLMAMNLNGNYQITGGGDGNPFIDASATGAGAGSNMWTSAGFVPVGSISTPFTGTLDGQSGVIDSLTINRPSADFVGMFGVVGTSGLVENVNLTNVDVTGQEEVGGIAGLNDGTITGSAVDGAGGINGRDVVGGIVGENHSHVTNSSSNTSVGGEYEIGGLVGWNASGGSLSGDLTSNSVVEATAFDVGGLVGLNDAGIAASTSNSTVLGGSYAGGLVGYNNGSIITSYATASVTGLAEVGGLVGSNLGTVHEDYAASQVTGNGPVGGLIGRQDGGSVTDDYSLSSVTGTGTTPAQLGSLFGFVDGGTINHVYASGLVTAPAGSLYLGGIVGYEENAVTISNAYWDEGTTGQTSAGTGFTGTATGVGGTTGRNPYAQATYSGLEDGHWLFVAGVRPMLAMEYSTTITNAHQLQLMATNVNASYTLANDIDLSATESGGDVWSDAGFVPIYLAGSLDGQNFTIFHLYENNPSSNAGTGLFAQIDAGATVQNLALAEANVTGGNFVGTLAGSNLGLVQNVTVGSSIDINDSTVTGNNYVGGLVGANSAGGQIGTAYGPEDDELGLTGGVAISNVTVSGAQGVGGVAGWNAGSIAGGSDFGQSAAAAVVSGTSQVGGFVGWNTGSIDSALVAVDSVTGSGFGIGGIVGYNAAFGSITNSLAADAAMFGGLAVPATTGVIGGSGGGMGGVVGLNAGTISGSQDVFLTIGSASTISSGGFAGQNTGTIEDSLAAAAAVSGSENTGGFVGYNSGLIATSTATEVLVTGVQRAGGFAGVNAAGGIIADSSSDGTVTATGNRIGGFVGWNAGTLNGSVAGIGDDADVTVSGASQVGGLVGWNDGAVTQTSADGDVTASGSGGGGLVGYNTSTASITDSYATGGVSGTGGDFGGLVGVNNGSITNAFATGNVGTASTLGAGGLIGLNNGSVSDVYASGTVPGYAHNNDGALVGSNTATGDIQNAYYISTVNAALRAAGSNTGTLDATAMGGVGQPSPTSETAYVGFDFTDVWTITPGDMPTLQDAP
jgi:filamentous hemagglutinin family protein